MQKSTSAEEDAYHEVCAYTLTLGDATFIHQHVVDAWAVQRATPATKPIAVCFGLVGLYLHVERGSTGREAQLAHIALAKHRESWPTFTLPDARGAITAQHVLAAAEGEPRNAMIHAWAESVWAACAESREVVEELLSRRGIIPKGTM